MPADYQIFHMIVGTLLHKFFRMNNPVLKACYDMFSHSVKYTLLCYSFYIALDLCSEVDIKSKVFSVFNHVLFIVVECHSC